MQRLAPQRILRGLDHTCHVDVVLETQDNHQAIFESLNAKFEPLSLLDKVRNFALMGLGDDEMTCVWNGPWRAIEDRYASSGEEDRGRKEAAFGLLARDMLVLAGARERRRNGGSLRENQALGRSAGNRETATATSGSSPISPNRPSTTQRSRSR